MKTFVSTLLFFCLATFSIAQGGDDKIFQKGNHVCEAGVGISLFFNSMITTHNPDTTFEDSIGSVIFPVRYQYAVTNWLGVGGMLRFHNYLEGDSNNTQALGIDIGARADFHYLRTRRLDFSGAIGIGYTHASWKWNDAGNVHFYGNGLHYDLELTCRFYFSDHFGLNLNYGRIYQNMPKVIAEDDYGNHEEYGFFFKGGQFSIGLQIKL